MVALIFKLYNGEIEMSKDAEISSELAKTIDNIVDVFTGADGGVDFVKFRILIACLDKQKANGDLAAKKILNVVFQFSQLLNIAKREST